MTKQFKTHTYWLPHQQRFLHQANKCTWFQLFGRLSFTKQSNLRVLLVKSKQWLPEKVIYATFWLLLFLYCFIWQSLINIPVLFVNISSLNFCCFRFCSSLTNRQLSINYKQGFAELRNGLAPPQPIPGATYNNHPGRAIPEIRTLFRGC